MSSPTLTDLTAVIEALRCSVLSLEDRLGRMEHANRARIATVSMTPMSPPIPPTQGKARAHAAPAPSKTKPVKKDRPTKKAAIPSDSLPLHLAQTFPQEGKPDRHLVTVAIPDATAAHVIGQGGKGLKQLHDISGARVSAYTLTTGPRDERHVSIRGTDEQIGDALVVLGKRMARKRIHGPKTKKTVPGKSPSSAVPAPPPVASLPSTGGPAAFGARRPSPPAPPRTSYQPASLLPHPPSQYRPPTAAPPAPLTRAPSASPAPPATVVMASPSPSSTPHAPTVVMGSPSLSGTAALTPMQVDTIHTVLNTLRSAAPTAPPRKQTARRGGGPPKGT